jgi:hypothetical protein
MHADRTNRSTLTLLAVLLIAAGAAAGAASLGLFGTTIKHRSLLHHAIGDFYGRHGDWLWPVSAIVALLVVLVALRWLLALLFTTDRTGDLRVPGGGGAGRTTLAPGAVTEAVVEEIESYRGVGSVRARLIGDPANPQLVVTATLKDSADLAALRRRIQTDALAHARAALDRPDLPAQLDLTVTTKRPTRVT